MALILTLNEGEFVWIGKEITLTVKKKNGSGIMLAIEAPRDVEITRSKFLEKQQQQQQKELTK